MMKGGWEAGTIRSPQPPALPQNIDVLWWRQQHDCPDLQRFRALRRGVWLSWVLSECQKLVESAETVESVER